MSNILMGLGVKAMTASYSALQTAGHNIANSSVTGYSRQQVMLKTASGLYTEEGFYGRGVDVETVSRKHDLFLTREAISTQSMAAMDAARLQQLDQLEGVFRTGELGLGHATSELLSAMVDLSSRPADLATRQVVLARAGDLALRFDEASAQLDDSQKRVTHELSASVEEINGLLVGVAEANRRITSMRGSGQEPNDLLDERDRMVSQLSGLIKLTRLDGDDGATNLFSADGQRLVTGTSYADLTVQRHEADPTRSAVQVSDFGFSRTLEAAALGGGKIAGLLKYQNEDLTFGRNQIGRLAASLAGAINKQQQFGLNLQTPLGQVQSRPLFETGPALALGYQTNARDGSGLLIGSVAITITDPAALQASDYELHEDPTAPGNWQLTREADGLVRSVSDGDTVDGFRIDFGSPGPQSGDQFLLQPVARAATGIQRLLNDPRDLAAALPLLATRGATNVGTAGVARLEMTASPLPHATATAQITFTSDNGDYSWDLLDASNTVISSGSGVWTAGQVVPTAPVDINGFSLLLEGVPRSGDVLRVAPTPASAVASNNGNALLLMGLRDAAIVGGRSPIDAWALAVSEVGVRAQVGGTAAEISAGMATVAESQRSGLAGVNLDEEAATLIQYQQTYQAAAKVLQVAQSLFDSLMQATGR